MRRLIFPYESPYEITRAVVEKSLGIDGRMVVEIPGPRVFIVEGSGGVYVVTLAPGLNPLCTCLAGKTKPELACKHVLKVLTINREEAA
jgi:hypothetical protein